MSEDLWTERYRDMQCMNMNCDDQSQANIVLQSEKQVVLTRDLRNIWAVDVQCYRCRNSVRFKQYGAESKDTERLKRERCSARRKVCEIMYPLGERWRANTISVGCR